MPGLRQGAALFQSVLDGHGQTDSVKEVPSCPLLTVVAQLFGA
jgi:hypothetical protein